MKQFDDLSNKEKLDMMTMTNSVVVVILKAIQKFGLGKVLEDLRENSSYSVDGDVYNDVDEKIYDSFLSTLRTIRELAKGFKEDNNG